MRKRDANIIPRCARTVGLISGTRNADSHFNRLTDLVDFY